MTGELSKMSEEVEELEQRKSMIAAIVGPTMTLLALGRTVGSTGAVEWRPELATAGAQRHRRSNGRVARRIDLALYGDAV